jgi:glycosyltransferase involved in cell wall biosynthesis
LPKNVVIVSPYFPPSTLAGVHRARHLAKHLPAAGWTPLVICVDEAFHEQKLDPDLAALVPSTVEIIKVPAIPARFSRAVGLGEISLRAWYPLRAAVFRVLASRKIDTVLITGSPFYPMLLASRIKRDFGIPVVLDFQDPWVSAWGALQRWNSKAGLSHRLAKTFEPRALRGADFVTSVSDIQNAEMAARTPWLDPSRMAAIPIGGDPDDFVALRKFPPTEGSTDLDREFINLSFVGTFMPRSGELVRTLFRAFRRLRAEHPSLSARMKLNFIGTSNQPGDFTTYRVRPLAENEGVAESVREIPQRLPYLRALDVLTRSDGILLIGSDEPHYTASKIYSALMSGRPYLSLFHGASSAHKILSAAGGGCALGFASGDELTSLEQAIAEALRAVALAPETFGKADPAAYTPYEARSIAGKYAAIFEEISSHY